MKLLMIIFLNLILLGIQAEAATYTVKAGGGANFTTIQACGNAAVAGDTCTVFSGTYNETVTLPRSGSPGNPITFQVNPGDCVTMHGFTLGSLSYITIGSSGATCTNGSFTYSGFEITAGNVNFTSMSHVIIQNNYVHDTGANKRCVDGPSSNASGASTYNTLLNNTLTRCGSGSGSLLTQGLIVEGNHWLIDGNTFSHLEDGIALYGDHHVVRNNHFGPLNLTADLGGDNSIHPDMLESSVTGSCVNDYVLTRLVFENNVGLNWGNDGITNAHTMLLRDTVPCGQSDNLIRLNSVINNGSYWIATSDNSKNLRIYNNSISNTEVAFATKERSDLAFTNMDTGAKVINNAFVNMEGQTHGAPWCIYVDTTSSLTENHNLCFVTGNSSWVGPPSSGGNSNDASDIFNQDPLYVNPTSDLHPQAGSPAIGAGGPLTTAVGVGASSTALTVADAGFFSDGYGITNVQPDWIRIGPSTTVQISSINYATNVITLASAVGWSNGAPIYLYKDSSGNVVLNGANPDIGASHPTLSGFDPPTGLKAAVN